MTEGKTVNKIRALAKWAMDNEASGYVGTTGNFARIVYCARDDFMIETPNDAEEPHQFVVISYKAAAATIFRVLGGPSVLTVDDGYPIDSIMRYVAQTNQLQKSLGETAGGDYGVRSGYTILGFKDDYFIVHYADALNGDAETVLSYPHNVLVFPDTAEPVLP